MPQLRLAHLSDLHLRHAQPGSAHVVERRSRVMLELLSRALEEIAQRYVDFLAITGDLIDVPHHLLYPNDYYAWQQQQELQRSEAIDDYRAIKQLLDATGMPYLVLPGNHDYEPAFWEVFDRGPHLVSAGGYAIARFCDREWEGHVPRRLDRERKFWARLLSDPNAPPQIHLQHYVITPELNQGYPHTYFEHEELKRRMVASGTMALSLSGHYHSGTDLIREGACTFTTAPAFCDFPHRYRIYELHDHDVASQTHALLQQPHGAGRRAVFLDRDGVINTLAAYSSGPDEMKLIPGSAAAIRRLREAGFACVVVSNQSAIGMGYVTPETVQGVNERMCRLLRDEAGSPAAEPDAIFFSRGAEHPCHPVFGDMRDSKPEPHYIHRAAELLGLNLSGSYMIGDRASDMEFGHRAGLTAILVRTGAGAESEHDAYIKAHPNCQISADLAAAADAILANDTSKRI